MNIEEFREYCISIKGSSESFPFLSDTVLVFKVMDKMFAYIDIAPKDGKFNASMKCDAEKSVELRERYEGIKGGTHTKSFLWNTVYLDSDLPDSLIKELIDHSVSEVIKKLPKKKRDEYNQLEVSRPLSISPSGEKLPLSR